MAQAKNLQEIDEKELQDVVLVRTATGSCLRGCFGKTRGRVAVKLLSDSKWPGRMQEIFKKNQVSPEKVLVPLGVYRTGSLVGLLWDWMGEGSLDSILHETNPPPVLSMDFCLRVQLDVAEGFSYLHGISVPHGGLKATNVLFDRHYSAKLCDWGQEMDIHLIMSSSMGFGPCYRDLTYIAPEVLQGTKSSVKADIFSFGVLLWETLNRKRPCEGYDDLQAVMLSAPEMMQEEAGVERSSTPNQALTQLITRCLSGEPLKRPSAHDCAEVLRKILAGFNPQNFAETVCNIKTSKERALSSKTHSSWKLPIELRNKENNQPKKLVSKVVPWNETPTLMSSPNSKRNISLPMTTRSFPSSRCFNDNQKITGQSGHTATTASGTSRYATAKKQHTVTNQASGQPPAGRSCCRLLQESRCAIVHHMTEGRLNHLLDVLRARQAVTHETYETITAALTLNARTRCLLDTCSFLGEHVASLVATTLGLVPEETAQSAH